jgi:hypothetical protein
VLLELERARCAEVGRDKVQPERGVEEQEEEVEEEDRDSEKEREEPLGP